MGDAARTLSHAEAKRFYDRLGSLQDWQWPFEQPAREQMVAHLELGGAKAVFELGCGTGRFAKDLLERSLSLEARYLAVDASETMLSLSRRSLGRFGGRVEVRASSGELRFDVPDGSFDRWNHRRAFRTGKGTMKVFHRDHLPVFHEWACNELKQDESFFRLEGSVSCRINKGERVVLVPENTDVCSAENYGVVRP